jgi:hypothetical protein
MRQQLHRICVGGMLYNAPPLMSQPPTPLSTAPVDRPCLPVFLPLVSAACQPTANTPEPSKVNAMLPIGGPGKALSAKEQADILFR